MIVSVDFWSSLLHILMDVFELEMEIRHQFVNMWAIIEQMVHVIS